MIVIAYNSSILQMWVLRNCAEVPMLEYESWWGLQLQNQLIQVQYYFYSTVETLPPATGCWQSLVVSRSLSSYRAVYRHYLFIRYFCGCQGFAYLFNVNSYVLQSSYKTEAQLQKLDENINKGPNIEILLHEKKRKVELKCLEMQELMEEQGYVFDRH